MSVVTQDLTSNEAAMEREIGLARRERRAIPAPRGSLDLDGAYRIQRHRLDGADVIGRKLGMINDAQREGSQAAAPVHGPVLAEMLLEGPVVDLGAFLQPRLEPELAVVLTADLRANASPGDVARAVTGLFLAVDILDTIWEDCAFGLPEAVADGVSGGGFLLGEQLLPLDASGELRLHLDGALVAAGSIGDLGDPVTRIAWLAAEVGGLSARDVVFLGTPATDVPAQPGTLLLEGPGGAVLCADLRGVA